MSADDLQHVPMIRKASRNTPTECEAAARTCAAYATDADDLRLLLEAVGLR